MWWTRKRRPIRIELDDRRRISVSCVFERIDNPQRIQAHGNRHGLSIRDDSPRQLLVSEISGNDDAKHAPLPPREEVCGLPLIGTTGLDAIVWPDWNFEKLLRIPIEVAQQKAVGAVRVLIPAFKRSSYALS